MEHRAQTDRAANAAALVQGEAASRGDAWVIDALVSMPTHTGTRAWREVLGGHADSGGEELRDRVAPGPNDASSVSRCT